MSQLRYGFDTANFEPKWQIEAATAEVSCFFDLIISSDHDPSTGYNANYQLYKTGSIIFALCEADPYEKRQGWCEKFSAVSSYYFVVLVLDGWCDVFIDGQKRRIEGNSLELGSIDNQKKTLFSKCKTLHVFFRLSEFEGLENIIQSQVASSGDRLPYLLAEYLRSVAPVLPCATDEEMMLIGETTKSIMRASLICPPTRAKSTHSVPETSRLYSIKKFIRENLRSSHLDLKELEMQLNISRRSLHKIFEPEGGVANFIRSARLEMAWNEILLSRGNLPVNSIAENTGFSDPYVFSRLFKAKYGHSPKTISAIANNKGHIKSTDLERMF